MFFHRILQSAKSIQTTSHWMLLIPKKAIFRCPDRSDKRSSHTHPHSPLIRYCQILLHRNPQKQWEWGSDVPEQYKTLLHIKQDRTFRLEFCSTFAKLSLSSTVPQTMARLYLRSSRSIPSNRLPQKGIRQHMFFSFKANIDRYQMMLRFPLLFSFLSHNDYGQCFFDTLSGLL